MIVQFRQWYIHNCAEPLSRESITFYIGWLVVKVSVAVNTFIRCEEAIWLLVSSQGKQQPCPNPKARSNSPECSSPPGCWGFPCLCRLYKAHKKWVSSYSHSLRKIDISLVTLSRSRKAESSSQASCFFIASISGKGKVIPILI